MKHPSSRAERLKLRELYLKKKYEEKAIKSNKSRPKRKIKEFIEDQETRDELQGFKNNKNFDLLGQSDIPDWTDTLHNKNS